MRHQQSTSFMKSREVRHRRVLREQVWSALMEGCSARQTRAVSREEVLRELLDDAHARIRSLEAALDRLATAASESPIAYDRIVTADPDA